MSNRTRVVVGLLLVFVVVGTAVLLFLRYQIRKSFPETSGTLSLNGLQSGVHVYRDAFGVPSLEATNERDLMFALGYVHAQDRLWQMDMGRRIGAGRLSELFGSATLPFDKMFRIVGIQRIAEEVERSILPESRSRLSWYADGVNAFITMHKGKYPVEFDLLRYDPEPWAPVHSIILSRVMAWNLNLSWWTDLTLGAIVERVGMPKAADILPGYPANVEPIFHTKEVPRGGGRASGFLKTAQDFRSFMGSPGTLGGSNCWVVSPSKSVSKSVILANDIHLQLHAPSMWYEVCMKAPSYSLRGMSIPGIPGVVAGCNDSIAWGVTNLMVDDADFYVEKIDSVDTTQYWYEGRKRPISSREEEIRLKGDTVVSFVVRSTHHGPIITDIHTMLQKAQPSFVASMRWTGAEIGDPIEAFNRLDRASNWRDFRRALKEFTGPGQNFVYGDRQGNIGYQCGVLLPKRSSRSTTLPLAGWISETEWKGFVPFEELPHLFNPPEGYIATANNKVVDDAYPYHVSDLWEPPSRILRLREVLGRDELFSSADFERLQNDTFSHMAKTLTPYILTACNDSASMWPNGSLMLDYLRNWNFTFAKDEIPTTLFQQFFVRLLENTYKDEMGDDLFHDYVILVNIPLRVTAKLIEGGISPWFDDVRTPHVESRDDIIRRSMTEALQLLRDRFGPDMKRWRWGELHTVMLQHPFGLQKPLDKIFSVGPFAYDGGSTSLMSGEYSLNAPFAVTVGPAFRQIVDLATPTEVRTILPPGQSGQVFHRHYDDQTGMWLNGTLRISRYPADEAVKSSWEDLVLEPKR